MLVSRHHNRQLLCTLVQLGVHLHGVGPGDGVHEDLRKLSGHELTSQQEETVPELGQQVNEGLREALHELMGQCELKCLEVSFLNKI